MQNERITTETETYTKVFTPLDNRVNWCKEEGHDVEVLPFTVANTEYVCVISSLPSRTAHPVPDSEKSIDIYHLSGKNISSFNEMREILCRLAQQQQGEK